MSKIFIIGHKSPDLDSVAAAVSYANYKNKTTGTNNYAPATAGGINKESVYVLEKFSLERPEEMDSAHGEKLILVDHNELSQRVNDSEEAEILEVLDHHKVDFKHSEPIEFLVKPWGASCSIIAQKYFDAGIGIDTNMAGLMLSAILIDTVITKSPTCTEFDRGIIKKLANIAGIEDWQEFGMELFKVRSSVKELSEGEIIRSDFKDFNFKKGKFGVGQVETVDLSEFESREDALLEEMKKMKEKEGYHTVILFLTDIINEGSEFLAVSDEIENVGIALGGRFQNGRVYLKGVLSRKKQVAPKLMNIFD